MRFGRAGEIADLFDTAGVVGIVETTLEVSSTYAHFDELWAGYLAGIGPAGSYCVSLSESRRAQVHDELFLRLGSPTGPITLRAVARSAIGSTPG